MCLLSCLLLHDFLTSHSIAPSCLIRIFTLIYRLTDKLFINGNGIAEMRDETNDFLILTLHPLF
ncbi:hypothetical protein DWS23_09665 [Escherichia coli]|nr:hypothetical protein [Escherichia coli]EFO1362886.1 hypothetical protein [Escherichia coli]EFO1592547.1 hypothetical protein [Escherichia coli]EFO1630268.1 hypothetical protein [Escherichia coli]PSY66417.1 hypothetical protein C7B16_07935 [Escherichia sp. 20412-1]